MKHLVPFFLVFLVASCRAPEETPTFSSLIVKNQWKVGFARDFSNNVTGIYNGWRFSFSAAGTLTVTTGTSTLSGTWQENVPARKVRLLINSSTTPAAFASKEWDLVFMNPGRIKLAHNRFSPSRELYFDRVP